MAEGKHQEYNSILDSDYGTLTSAPLPEDYPSSLNSISLEESQSLSLNSFPRAENQVLSVDAGQVVGNETEAPHQADNDDPLLDQMVSMDQQARAVFSSFEVTTGNGAQRSPIPSPRHSLVESPRHTLVESPRHSLVESPRHNLDDIDESQERPIPIPRRSSTLPKPVFRAILTRQNSCPPNIKSPDGAEGGDRPEMDIGIELQAETGSLEQLTSLEEDDASLTERDDEQPALPPVPKPRALRLEGQSNQDHEEEKLHALRAKLNEGESLSQQELQTMVQLQDRREQRMEQRQQWLEQELREMKERENSKADADEETRQRVEVVERQYSSLSSRADVSEQYLNTFSGNYAEDQEHSQRQRDDLHKRLNENDKSMAATQTDVVRNKQSIKGLEEKSRRSDQKHNWSAELHKSHRDDIQGLRQSQAAHARSVGVNTDSQNTRIDQSVGRVRSMIAQFEGFSTTMRQLRNDVHEVIPEVPGILDYQADDGSSSSSSDSADGQSEEEVVYPEEEEHVNE